MTQLLSLTDRTIIRLTGEDTRKLLQGIITTDINTLSPQHPLFACILTPQGKWQHECFVVDAGDALLLDTHRRDAEAFIATLKKYRLRANVVIEDAGDLYQVRAALQAEPTSIKDAIMYRDPRHAAMGWRVIVDLPPTGSPASRPSTLRSPLEGGAQGADCEGSTRRVGGDTTSPYLQHRLTLGIPDGYYDTNERSYPIELGYDYLSGVDFTKGCYVGQEVTARMHFKEVRRRLPVIVQAETALPSQSTPLTQDGKEIGELRSVSDSIGLAIVLREAMHSVSSPTHALADGQTVSLRIPEWLHPALNT